MGRIVPDIAPETVFVIGEPSRSAIEAIPAGFAGEVVDLGGDKRPVAEIAARIAARAGGGSVVAVGNIHGQGERLLEHFEHVSGANPSSSPSPNPAGPADSDHFARSGSRTP
jgi:hypothetical protein